MQRIAGYLKESANLKQRAKELIKDLKAEGYSKRQIKDFLQDGAALKQEGYTDRDKPLIEEAYDMVKNAGMDISSAKKPVFGTMGNNAYAVKIDALSDNDYYLRPFGQQLEAHKIIKSWKTTAKTGYVGAKGKSTMAAVKAWVKEHNPKEFYARWEKDSSHYKDDTVEIFYK